MTTIADNRKTCPAGALAVLLLWCAHAGSRPSFGQGSVPKAPGTRNWMNGFSKPWPLRVPAESKLGGLVDVYQPVASTL